MLDLTEKPANKGVRFISQKECLDTATPTGMFTLTVLRAVAEPERGYILERQREGIAAAKAGGVVFGRCPIKLPDNFPELVKSWERGEIYYQKSSTYAEESAR